MGTYLNPGYSGFSSIRNDIYIDKSGLIHLINHTINTPRRLTCISRPRRFGKSFAAKMLCAYYDRSCDSSGLFDDLEIAKDPDYNVHRNQYDVIYLDMTGMMPAAQEKKQELTSFIVNTLAEELHDAYPKLKKNLDLSDMLSKAVSLNGIPFIMIIDEWDAPIRELPEQQGSYLKLLRALFKNSGTTDKIFAAAYLTGILPIKKDGSQSAISDFREYTMIKPRQFGEYVGFTEKEVQRLCKDYDVRFDSMKHWYDGYTIENVGAIYNPNSVMQAIENDEFDSYWKKTSAAESLLTYIDMDEDGLQEDVARLIGGEMIEVDPDGFENDLRSFQDKDDVFTLMIHLGYLNWQEDEDGIGYAGIPNEEIRMEFNKILRKGKHQELIRLVRESDELLKKTLAGDGESVAAAVSRVHDSNYAPQFYNDEQALRSTIRMAYLSCVDQYMKIEELPYGHGVADLVFLPKRRSMLPAMVMELKWDKTEAAAIAQIKDRDYPSVLQGFGGDILLVGINYDSKTKVHQCRIEQLERE